MSCCDRFKNMYAQISKKKPVCMNPFATQVGIEMEGFNIQVSTF